MADENESDVELNWLVALPLVSAVAVLIFSHFAMRHWAACAVAGLAVIGYFHGKGARRYRRGMLMCLLAGGGALALLAWFTPPGAMRSLNHLQSLDDENLVSFMVIGAGTFFRAGR